jgi:hypothetical protein
MKLRTVFIIDKLRSKQGRRQAGRGSLDRRPKGKKMVTERRQLSRPHPTCHDSKTNHDVNGDPNRTGAGDANRSL